MADLLENIRTIIGDPASIKIVATLSDDGTIHTAPKGTLKAGTGNQLEYVEIVESSESYKNVVRSLWYNKKVTVLVVGSDRQAYQIIGTVRRILTAGREYEKNYKVLLEKKGFDIAAVIKLDVSSVTDLDITKRIAKQEEEHFFFKHLDRIAVGICQ